MGVIVWCEHLNGVNEVCSLPAGHYCGHVFAGQRMPLPLAHAFYDERRAVREMERGRIISQISRAFEKLIDNHGERKCKSE